MQFQIEKENFFSLKTEFKYCKCGIDDSKIYVCHKLGPNIGFVGWLFLV